MKKVLAIVLSLVMMLGVLPLASSAVIAKDDSVMEYLLDGDNFPHLAYVNTKKDFRTEIAAYTALNLSSVAWDELVTGKQGVSAAKAVLLALIEKIDATYDDETFRDVIKFFEGVETAAGILEKFDSYTHIFDLAENSAWADSVTALKWIIKGANYGDELYRTFIDGLAAIASVQAASAYYGEFLDYIAENSENEAVQQAAREIKADIDKTYDEAVEALLAQIAETVATDGAVAGAEIAMDAWGVTAVIKTVYKTVENYADKLFNTQKKLQYMNGLVITKEIELVAPGYVETVFAGEDGEADAFAINVILTLREIGEDMLGNLGKVSDDAIVNVAGIRSGVSYANIKKDASKSMAILGVLRTLIDSDVEYVTAAAPQAELLTANDAVIYSGDEVIASLVENKVVDLTVTENSECVYACVLETLVGGTVLVVVPLADGVTVQLIEPANPTPSSSSSSSSSGNFFQRLIEAIKEIFAKLFSFGK